MASRAHLPGNREPLAQLYRRQSYPPRIGPSVRFGREAPSLAIGQTVLVVILGILVGVWFFAMGAYGATHANRSPESPAGHWMSHPGGRRIGGALTMAVGLAVVVGSLTLL